MSDVPIRQVSFVEYVHDLSCWGHVKQDTVKFDGLVIATYVAKDAPYVAKNGVILFPLAPHCKISEAHAWRYIPNVSFGSFKNFEEYSVLFEGRSIGPIPPEHFPIGMDSHLVRMSTSCRAVRPEHEPNSLVFEDCIIGSAEPAGRLTPKFFD